MSISHSHANCLGGGGAAAGGLGVLHERIHDHVDKVREHVQNHVGDHVVGIAGAVRHAGKSLGLPASPTEIIFVDPIKPPAAPTAHLFLRVIALPGGMTATLLTLMVVVSLAVVLASALVKTVVVKCST
jgi:hypothetical protein